MTYCLAIAINEGLVFSSDSRTTLPRSLLSGRNMSEAADYLGGISIGQRRALGSRSNEMSRSEKVKEEIGWLKVVFGILAAIDVSLLAWLAQNYRSANALLLVLGALAVAGITAAVVWVNYRAYQKIDELEEL